MCLSYSSCEKSASVTRVSSLHASSLNLSAPTGIASWSTR
nr:MAG TPA: hypothetical protein [Caudoviricetes sp.]